MRSTIPTGERFANISKPRIPRSKFDMSFGHRTTFFDTELFPVMIEEVYPGDTFDVSVSHVIRMLTPLRPLMDNIYVDFHFFYVPTRQVWDNFEKFMGAQDNPNDSIDYLVPVLDVTDYSVFTADQDICYFGIPPVSARNGTDVINSLPFRCYAKIWNEWFRDEDLQDSFVYPTGDGPDDYGPGGNDQYQLLNRAKRKDYFSSARPWPQKGPDVYLPLGSTAPVDLVSTPGGTMLVRDVNRNLVGAGDIRSGATGILENGSGGNRVIDPNGQLEADLNSALGATINSVREAIAIQHVLERDARGGTRFVEHLLNHWGVVSPDARLQRTEYLGGGRTRVGFQTVASTAETATVPQASLAGMGTSTGTGIRVFKTMPEHGYFFCLMSLVADQTYQQGLRRMWTRQTRYDFYLPDFANLGEQAILNKEIYYLGNGVAGSDSDVFGYQERFGELRTSQSYVTGAFYSAHPNSLDSWHLAYDFASMPALNSGFIPADPPIARVVAVNSPEQFVADLHFRFFATRSMPVRSNPGLTRF